MEGFHFTGVSGVLFISFESGQSNLKQTQTTGSSVLLPSLHRWHTQKHQRTDVDISSTSRNYTLVLNLLSKSKTNRCPPHQGHN